MTRMDDDGDDDRELPDPSDLDPGDEDGMDVGDPCPKCKKAVYEDAERCPHCGHYIERPGEGRPPWILIVGMICLFVVIVVWMYIW